jgi:hypothetical protein
VSQLDEKQETSATAPSLLLTAGAMIIAIFSMFMVSIGVILCTGLIFGGHQSGEIKNTFKKKSTGLVVISYSQPVEDAIRKSNLETPELPLKTLYTKQYTLRSFQYRYLSDY